MKKYITLIAVVVLVSFAISGMALAKADVQKLIPYAYPGEEPLCPDAFGKAVVNCPKGAVALVLTVSVVGLAPDIEYRVYLGDAPWCEVGTFTTNASGNGHFHMNWAPGDVPTNDLDPVAINTMGNKTVLIDEDF